MQLTLDQLLDLGFAHHQAGRFEHAAAVYREILQRDPDHCDALHLLGVVAHQTGEAQLAVELIRRAIAIRPAAEFYGNLGLALTGTGLLDEAVSACQTAIGLKPEFADAYQNLGRALYRKGDFEGSVVAIAASLRLKPGNAAALNEMGNSLRAQRRWDDAIAAYRQAIRCRPDFAGAHCNLADALTQNENLDEAIAVLRRVVALSPAYAEARNNLGILLRRQGHLEEAVTVYEEAIRVKPAFADAHNNLGVALQDQGRVERAIAAMKHAADLEPRSALILSNLGRTLIMSGRLDEAVEACRQAIHLQPDLAAAHESLGNALKGRSELDAAIASYRRAIDLDPQNPVPHGNLLCALLIHPACGERAIYEELIRWRQRHADPLKSEILRHTNDRDPDRRLRIGYVSPDFREHPVGRYLLPLLANHDHNRFEVVCYADLALPDDVSERLRSQADKWRLITGMSDKQLVELVRQDQVDILMDLALHTSGNRLLAFARKPAPVQISWLGYPGSTGLDTIDYRISDPHLDPLDHSDEFYSERTIRLPDCFWCCDSQNTLPPVNQAPVHNAGAITFGCLNNFWKVNDQVLQLWSRVLHAMPSSRLLILANPGGQRRRAVDQLAVDPQRIEFVTKRPRFQYLELYHRLDIALETFPYNGHTTTLDAMWMGVPTVTLVGSTIVGRAGLSLLTNVRLQELVAHTAEEYVKIAVDLANDVPRLSALRAGLRQRMIESPLTDAARFARNMEAIYRQMWNRWASSHDAATSLGEQNKSLFP